MNYSYRSWYSESKKGHKMRTCLFLLLMAFCSFGGTKRYVDGTLLYYGAQAGTSVNPFGGACGMQRALDSTVAGDTILIQDTCYTAKKIQISIDSSRAGAYATGDTMRNRTRAGTATVYSFIGDTSIGMCVTSGSYLINDSIDNSNGISSIIKKAPIYPGIIVTVPGTNAAPIYIFGTKTDWALDSTVYGVIYGNSTSKTWETTNEQWYYFQNMKFMASSTTGHNRGSGTNQYNAFTNCAFQDNVTDQIKNVSISTFDGCTFSGGGGNAVNGTAQIIVTNSLIRNIASAGFTGTGNLVITNSVISRCGTTGIIAGTNTLVQGCIIDSCVTGINNWTTNQQTMLIEKTKITNCKTAAITLSAGCQLKVGHGLVLLNNGGGNTITAGVTIAPFGFTTAGTQGYEDRANYIYNPTATATARRVPTHIGCY